MCPGRSVGKNNTTPVLQPREVWSAVFLGKVLGLCQASHVTLFQWSWTCCVCPHQAWALGGSETAHWLHLPCGSYSPKPSPSQQDALWLNQRDVDGTPSLLPHLEASRRSVTMVSVGRYGPVAGELFNWHANLLQRTHNTSQSEPNHHLTPKTPMSSSTIRAFVISVTMRKLTLSLSVHCPKQKLALEEHAFTKWCRSVEWGSNDHCAIYGAKIWFCLIFLYNS